MSKESSESESCPLPILCKKVDPKKVSKVSENEKPSGSEHISSGPEHILNSEPSGSEDILSSEPSGSEDISTGPEHLSSSEPCLSFDVVDELWDGEDLLPSSKVTLIEPHDTNSTIIAPEDYLLDELAGDIELHVAEEEGWAYYSGFLGKGNKSLTKQLAKGQKLPTSKLEDFDKFCCSEWVDLRNNAWKGWLPYTYILPFKISKISSTWINKHRTYIRVWSMTIFTLDDLKCSKVQSSGNILNVISSTFLLNAWLLFLI